MLFPVVIGREKIMFGNLSIKLFDRDTAFDVLREDWQRLYAQSEAAPFLSWEWTATWFKSFGNNRLPYVLAAYSGPKLVGLLPLYFEEKRILGMSLKTLAFINSEIGGAAYLDVLALPTEKTAATIAFLEFLTMRGGVDVLELEGIAADSTLLKQIEKQNAWSKFRLRVVPQDVCQFAEVGDDREKFLARIYNDTAKKKLKRLKKLSGFEFRRTTALAEIEAALQRFFNLHDGNWTQKGGSDVTGHQQLLDFHRAAATTGAHREAIFFDELWIENKCVASLYGFQKAGAYFYYSSGYDAQLAKLSPMVILYNLSIEKGLEDNVRTFDFLRGSQSYKAHWVNGQNELVTISLSRKTVPALMHDTISRTSVKLRDFSNSAIPSGVLEKLKNVRRRWKRNSRLTATPGKIVQETI